MKHTLEKPLYHGTSAAASVFICGLDGFKPPLYLTEDRVAAEHYAKAATAYVGNMVTEGGGKLIREGYAVFTFQSVPDKSNLIPDDYNPECEPGQWKYTKPVRGLCHFSVEHFPLEVNDDEKLRLICFAIGMWRR